MPREPAIRLEQLTKFYGRRLGVRDISFEVNPGEVVGFLGPNGSGKTTVLRSIMGLLRPTSGQAQLFGVDVQESGIHGREHTGYLPGTLSLYERMTASSYLRFIAAMRRRDCSRRIDELCERFAVDRSVRISEMSKGNKQKVGVVQAFMHDPDLLVMDEPTSGLDPLVQSEFDDLLRESTARGAAVLLSSHVMSEVERLASRVAIVNKGVMVAFDRVDVMKDRATVTIVLEFSREVDPHQLADVPGFVVTRSDGSVVTGVMRGPEAALLRRALDLGLVAVRSPEQTLDQLFRDLVSPGPKPPSGRAA
ncbi:MAG: hypothetical protein RLZZ305_1398 [Actinomycetota bacterium]